MGAIDKINFLGLTQAPKINPREQQRVEGFQPKVAPVSTGNEFGISMPGQIGFVNDEGGNKISLGQDGIGLAHRNPKEYGFMAIA